MLKAEVFYRGKPQKYNKPCTCFARRIVNEKIHDEDYEKRFYVKVIDKLHYRGFFKCENVEEESAKINTLSFLEHYSFSTGLLDVTRDVNVACYKNQNSFFVFCGNEIYKNKILNNRFTEAKYLEKEEVKGKDNLKNLAELTKIHKINHDYLLPDERESLINANLYFELTSLSSNDLISKPRKKIIQQLFSKTNEKNINAKFIKNILSDFESFTFFCYGIKYFVLNFTKNMFSCDALRTNTTLESLIDELIACMKKQKKIRRLNNYEARF